MPKFLLMDWGNTLMRVFPGMTGPMADWPVVEAMPGVLDSLAGLNNRYRVGIATNAQDSKPADIRRALTRVGLDPYISFIFTAREVGLPKSDPLFFSILISRLQATEYGGQALSNEDPVIIGDDYTADVLNAKKQGIKAIWYNPDNHESPTLPPQQDGDINHFNQLENSINQLTLPDVKLCLQWLSEQGLPPNIVSHSQTVAAAAYLLSVWLRGAGISVNPVLAHLGGLLQDLDKLTSRSQHKPHGEYSAELLSQKGQPELAEIARRHIINTILDPENRPRTWEERLVYFADKLTEGSQVGPLFIRLDALCKRYPDYAEVMLACRLPLMELEQDLCNRLKLSPDSLIEKLQAAISPFQH